MSIELKSKLSLSNFSPKRIHAEKDDVREITLGTIFGVANGIKKGFQADGVTPFEGLKGNFEINMTDAEGKMTRIGSGVCYLPDAFMQPILDQLSDEVDAEGVVIRAAATAVRFAFIVKAVRADNPAGYSWAVVPVGQPEENDPLADLRKSLTSPEAQKLLGKAETIEGQGRAPKKADTPA